MTSLNFYTHTTNIGTSSSHPSNTSLFTSSRSHRHKLRHTVSLYYSLSQDMHRHHQYLYEAYCLDLASNQYQILPNKRTRSRDCCESAMLKVHAARIYLREVRRMGVAHHDWLSTGLVWMKEALGRLSRLHEYALCHELCVEVAHVLEVMGYVGDAVSWCRDSYVYAEALGHPMATLQRDALDRIEALLLNEKDFEALVEVMRWRIRVLSTSDVPKLLEAHVHLVLGLLLRKASRQVSEALDSCRKYAAMHELKLMHDELVPLLEELVDACSEGDVHALRVCKDALDAFFTPKQRRLLSFIENVYSNPLYMDAVPREPEQSVQDGDSDDG